MSNLHELADEWSKMIQQEYPYACGSLVDVGNRMADVLRAQADAADKVRDGITHREMVMLATAIEDECACSQDHYCFKDIGPFARAIAAHFAPILAENEQLRAQLATARNDALEEAAEVATVAINTSCAEYIPARIRALKGKP